MSLQKFYWLSSNLKANLEQCASPKVIKKTKHMRTPRTEASGTITRFCSSRLSKRGRQGTIAKNIEPYTRISEQYMPTSWVRSPLNIPVLTLLDMTDESVVAECRMLCLHRKLHMPCDFLIKNAHHYAYYENGKMTVYMVLSVATMNYMPVSIMVSVDMIASINDTHVPTQAIDEIKKILRKRRLRCILFAQVVNDKKTRKWWKGKLNENGKSSVPTALLHEFDPNYPIYEGCTDFALFYD